MYIGFDPSFLDTIVRLEDNKGELIDKLPLVGHHHRNSKIFRIAGGNGVNIAATLKALGIPVKLIVPTTDEFTKLLNERGIYDITAIGTEISETVAINWVEGEIQMNEVRSNLSAKNWTREVHELWMNNPVDVYLNWGLNKSSLEWVYLQWLGSCGVKYSDINFVDLQNQVKKYNYPLKPVIIEPGSIKDHKDKNELVNFLKYIDSVDSKFPMVLCANEEEEVEFVDINNITKIIHSSSEIKIMNTSIIEVPEIKDEIVTFVGAGDAFTSGIIYQLMNKNEDLIEIVNFAINIAQQKITGKLGV